MKNSREDPWSYGGGKEADSEEGKGSQQMGSEGTGRGWAVPIAVP